MGAVDRDELGIYCNDHLAASAGGIGLVRRMLATAPGAASRSCAACSPSCARSGPPGRTPWPPRHPGPPGEAGLVALAEKASRLKPDGRLGRAPLSTVVEFEFLTGAVLLKRAGFETLLGLSEVDPRIDAARITALSSRPTGSTAGSARPAARWPPRGSAGGPSARTTRRTPDPARARARG